MTAISDELIQRLREICRGGQGTYAIRRDAGQAADALQQARARIEELERKELELSAALCDEAARIQVIADLQAALAGVRAGTHRIVPKEPTPAMVESGINAAYPPSEDQSVQGIYRAMLDAALKAAGSEG